METPDSGSIAPLIDALIALVQVYWPLAVAALAGALISSLIWLRRSNLRARAAFETGLTQDADKRAQEARLVEERMELRAREMIRLEGRLETLTTELGIARGQLEEKGREVAEDQAKQAGLEARLEESR